MKLKAPNGNISNLNPTQYHLVRTDSFKAWFGDWEKLAMAKLKDSAMDEVTLANLSKDVSKVLDDNGEPLVIYHGTKDKFYVFDLSYFGKTDMGFYGKGFYFTQSKENAETYAAISESNKTNNTYNQNGIVLSCFLNLQNPIIVKSKIDFINASGKREIRDGYDGKIVIPNNLRSYNTEFIAFEPNQIKLADGTNTTFDDSNNDIRFNNGGKMKSVSKGTITIGASHEEGGIPVYNRGTDEMLEVEGGEGIINKRSMALNKEVTFNGEKMTPCEVASEINQMGGGVTYECDNVGLSKEKYDDGGEFEQQLDNDDEYYSNLRGVIIDSQQPQTIKDRLRMIEPYRKKFECGCETKKYNGGGQAKDLSDVELPKISDDYDILGEKGLYEQRPKIELSERDKVKAEKLGSAIKIMQDLLNVDYKPIIMADQENKKLHRYVEKYKHLNLYKLGWRANVGRSKAWAGVCYGNDIKKVKRLLFISYDFIVGDDAFAENIEDIMLHEISHAIVHELFILNDFDLPLEKLKPSRIKDLSIYKERLDIIDQTNSESGGHGIMWAAVCESISKGFICDMFYRLAKNNELMLDYMYKCIRCDHEEFGRTPNFAQKCSKCQTPVLIIKNK
jgi:hypothetical protein